MTMKAMMASGLTAASYAPRAHGRPAFAETDSENGGSRLAPTPS